MVYVGEKLGQILAEHHGAVYYFVSSGTPDITLITRGETLMRCFTYHIELQILIHSCYILKNLTRLLTRSHGLSLACLLCCCNQCMTGVLEGEMNNA